MATQEKQIGKLEGKITLITGGNKWHWLGNDEAVKAVVFLASDDNSYITETGLFVDGGMAQV